LVRLMSTPEFKSHMEKQGFEIVTSTPEECDSLIASEVAQWTKVVKDAGIKPQ